MGGYEEKRQSVRYPLEAIVMYYLQNYPSYSDSDLTEIDHPRSVDLSYDGMQFVTGQDLPEGSHLKIILYPAPAGASLMMIGKVVWNRLVPGQINHRIGVEFVDYLEGCGPALQEMLGRLESK